MHVCTLQNYVYDCRHRCVCVCVRWWITNMVGQQVGAQCSVVVVMAIQVDTIVLYLFGSHGKLAEKKVPV